MNTHWIWNNLLAYSLQLGLLIGGAALGPAAFRLRSPRARLLYRQLALLAGLLLPAVHPWRTPPAQDAAIDAARQWRYQPFLDKGQAVDVNAGIDIDFKLPRR